MHQGEYNLAKKNAKLVAKKLGISEEEAEGRIVAEILSNSDAETANAAGGKHDYELRSIIGCQNLNCDGDVNDPEYANHDYNSEFTAENQAGYDAGQGQLGKGQTYNDLVADNIRKDPIGAALAGLGMVGFGLVTGTGLPALGMAGTGAGIGMGVNGVAQWIMGDSFDGWSFAMAGITGAASSGLGFLPAMFINTGGALAGSGMQGRNPNGSMTGAAIGTAIGYPIGSKIEGGLNNVLNPWYRQDWKDVGMGVSKWAPKTPLPSWAGGAGSGGIQEVLEGLVQKTGENKK
ncbi:hypothetical protein ACXX82_02505 [Glaciimonas sp. GNP009]